jgi:hypothetical protein
VNVGFLLTTIPPQAGVNWVNNPFFSDAQIILSDPQGCTMSQTLLAGAGNQYQWLLGFVGCTGMPTVDMAFFGGGGWVDIHDGRGAGVDVASGIPIMMEVLLRDSNTLTEFANDRGNENFVFMTNGMGASASVTATTATLDVATQRATFVVPGPGGDTLNEDRGAGVNLGFNSNDYDWAGPRNNTFSPNGTTLGFFRVTYTSPDRDFHQFAGGYPTINSHSYSVGDFNTRSYDFSNVESTSGAFKAIRSRIDGSTGQAPGRFVIEIDYYRGTCGGGSCTSGVTLMETLVSGTVYTTWGLNGTILFAPFANGNTVNFMQRFYICAPLSQVGATYYDVSVWSLPVDGSTSAQIGAAQVPSILNPFGCVNIRMEDVLAATGLPIPYVGDGGNVAVIFTIHALDAVGIHQTANRPNLESFVTAPLVRLNKGGTWLLGPISLDPGL